MAVAPVPPDRRNEGHPPTFVPCGSLRTAGPPDGMNEDRIDDAVPALLCPEETDADHDVARTLRSAFTHGIDADGEPPWRSAGQCRA